MTGADCTNRLLHVSSLSALCGNGDCDAAQLGQFSRSTRACLPPWSELVAAAQALQQQAEESLSLRDALSCLTALRRACASLQGADLCSDVQDDDVVSAPAQWACVLHMTLGVLLRHGQAVTGKSDRPAKKARGKQAAGSTAKSATLTPKQLEQILDACMACSERYWAALADGRSECDACLGILVSVVRTACQLAGGSTAAQAAAVHGRLCGFLPNVLALEAIEDDATAWRSPTSATTLCHGLLSDPLQTPLLHALLQVLSKSQQDAHQRVCAAVCCTIQMHLAQLATAASKGKGAPQASAEAAALLKQLADSDLPVLAASVPLVTLCAFLAAPAAALRKAALTCVYVLAEHALPGGLQGTAEPERGGTLQLAPLATVHPPRRKEPVNDAPDGTGEKRAPKSAVLWLCATLAQHAADDRDATCRKQACAAVTGALLRLLGRLTQPDDRHRAELERCAGSLVATLGAAAKRDAAKTVRAEAMKGLTALCQAVACRRGEAPQALGDSVRFLKRVGLCLAFACLIEVCIAVV